MVVAQHGRARGAPHVSRRVMLSVRSDSLDDGSTNRGFTTSQDRSKVTINLKYKALANGILTNHDKNMASSFPK